MVPTILYTLNPTTGEYDAVVSLDVVDVGFQEPARNRELDNVLTTASQFVRWEENYRPRDVELILSSGDAYVCFDAPNDMVAEQWLADGGGQATDAMRHYVAAGRVNKFQFSGKLTRMDMVAITAPIVKTHVEAE